MKQIQFLLVWRCPIMDRQTHPPSEFILSRKHRNILCFWIYSCWNLFEFPFWSTVLMKWELFPRHWNPGKGGWEHFVEQTNLVPPTLMRTAGFVRQEEWLEFFFLVLIWSFSRLWQLVGILNSLRLTGSTASCKTKSYLLIFYLVPPNHPFAGGHLCTFVSCNCVNVPVS